VVAVGTPHHVTQRENDRQQVYSHSQRRSYLALLAEHAARHELHVLSSCLMVTCPRIIRQA
jgi:REP element-mobilizing transposase RayT